MSFPPVPKNTEVYRLVTNLTALTDRASITSLASVSEGDKDRARRLRAKLFELQSDDPAGAAQEIDLRIQRLRVLLNELLSIDEMHSDASIATLFDAVNQSQFAEQRLVQFHAQILDTQPLPNTGSTAWRQLWRAAERYSKDDAYPDQSFPYSGSTARCVLCQQELTEEGAGRFRQFRDFIGSDLQRDRDRAKTEADSRIAKFRDLALTNRARDALRELHLRQPELSQKIQSWIEAIRRRKTAVDEALREGSPSTDLPPLPISPMSDIAGHVDELGGRVASLRNDDRGSEIEMIRSALLELEARQVLADNIGDVLAEIDRKTRIAVYQDCIAETRTNAITLKSTEVTQRVVTEELTDCFQEELRALGFRHVEVQMVPAGGTRGALYHRLQLRRAPTVEIPSVVSDGEARCLSIASFFAELSTAAHRSAILFDDPVSSLDHTWRRSVADRLARESVSRQVVVFTHDIVFLQELVARGKHHSVDVLHQRLRRDHAYAGWSSQQLPWIAAPVNKRLGRLRDTWQRAEKAHRTGKHDEYQMLASWIYGRLRESWERGVEEVLLNGTMGRFQTSIQTQRAMKLADICQQDVEELDAGMTKCSTWLPGHDLAPATNAPLPEPQEVWDDIDAFDAWVKRIRDRR